MFLLVSNPLTYMKQLPNNKIKDYTKQVKEQNEGENVNYIEIAIIKSLERKGCIYKYGLFRIGSKRCSF